MPASIPGAASSVVYVNIYYLNSNALSSLRFSEHQACHIKFVSGFQEKEKKFMLPLDNIKVKDADSGFMSKRSYFNLFHSENRNVYKDFKGEMPHSTPHLLKSYCLCPLNDL